MKNKILPLIFICLSFLASEAHATTSIGNAQDSITASSNNDNTTLGATPESISLIDSGQTVFQGYGRTVTNASATPEITQGTTTVRNVDNVRIVFDGGGTVPTDPSNPATTGAKTSGTGTFAVSGNGTTYLEIENDGDVNLTERLSMNNKNIVNLAAGVNGTDAVNVSQLNAQNDAANAKIDAVSSYTNARINKAYSGIAGIAAMNGIPDVPSNKKYILGAGVGRFEGSEAIAIGGTARFSQSFVGKAAVSYSNRAKPTLSAGAGFAF